MKVYNKNESAGKNGKSQCWSETPTEHENTGHGDADPAALWETPAMQPEGLSDGELTNISKESDCDQRTESLRKWRK